jgi:hypothetical protein
MSKISYFTSKAVWLAKNAVGGRGFADYAVVSPVGAAALATPSSVI